MMPVRGPRPAGRDLLQALAYDVGRELLRVVTCAQRGAAALPLCHRPTGRAVSDQDLREPAALVRLPGRTVQ